MGDAILEVLGGGWDEAEGLVERLEVALGAEAHGHFWKVEAAVADAFRDHFFPKAGATEGAGGQDPPEGWLWAFGPGIDEAQVSGEVETAMTGQVPSDGIVGISVLVGALLFDDKNLFTGGEDGVDFRAGEVFQSAPSEDE